MKRKNQGGMRGFVLNVLKLSVVLRLIKITFLSEKYLSHWKRRKTRNNHIKIWLNALRLTETTNK